MFSTSAFKFFLLFFASSTVFASNSGVTYQGRIVKPDGTALSGHNVQFKMQLRTPDASNCLFYEEVQSQDLSETNGSFSLTINDGTGSRTDATGFNLDAIFSNAGSFTFNPATCSSGSTYTPNENDGRAFVVLFKDETMATWEPIPAQKINFVPFSFDAKHVQGFNAASLVRVYDSGAYGNISPLSNAQYNALLALANGSSTAYTQAGTLNGSAMPTMSSGQVLGWNGSAWVSEQIGSTQIANSAVSTSQLSSSLTINTSGTLGAAVTTTRDFKIYAASPSTYAIDMQAPALTASYSLVWPLNAGTNGQVLTTDGSGNLSWGAGGVSSQWTTHGSNISYDGGGNVGIGTTSPSATLQVAGTLAAGTGASASGANSSAFGASALASGSSSFAAGAASTASATNSFALGYGATATASRAGALGHNVLASGAEATAIGSVNTASGTYSVAIGRGVIAAGDNSIAVGAGDPTGAPPQVTGARSIGFFLGDQSGANIAANNVMSILGGNVGIGTTSPSTALDVVGAVTSETVTAASSSTKQVASPVWSIVSNAWSSAPASQAVPFAIQWTAGAGDNSGDALVNMTAGTTTGFFTGKTEFRMKGNNAYLNVWNSNDNVSAFYGESFSAAQFGLKNNLGAPVGVVPANSSVSMLTLTNGGVVETSQTFFGNPSGRNILDDGTSYSRVGIGTTAPTARLHLGAGTATAGTAPLKFTGGALLTTAEDGAMEYDSSSLYYTIGSARYVIPLNTASGNYSSVSTISNTSGSITMSPMAGNSVIVNSSTVSTSSTTGALVVNGGAGIAGAINASGNITSGGSITAMTSAYIPQLYGSNAASGAIRIDGTSNATPGNIYLASSGGSVGVGTTAPGAAFDVYGAGRFGMGTVLIGNSGGQVYSAMLLDLASPTGVKLNVNGTTALQAVAGGNVGIGTTSPAGRLEVDGSVDANQLIVKGNSTQTQALAVFENSTGGSLANISGAGRFNGADGLVTAAGFQFVSNANGLGLYRPATDTLGFVTANNERMRIGSSGNVGIGTTAPTSMLTVGGTVESTSGGVKFPDGSIQTSASVAGTGGGGTTWQMIQATDLATAATSYTFNGLVGDTDIEYRVVARIIAGSSSATNYAIQLNGDSGTNYGFQYVQSYGGTPSAGQGSSGGINIGYTTSGGAIVQAESLIYAKSGAIRTFHSTIGQGLTGVNPTSVQENAGTWNNSASQVTSLVVSANQASGLAAGTHLEIWAKRTWAGNSQWLSNSSNIYFNTGNVGIGTTSPSAALALKAGTAAAGTAPLKLTAGTNLTTPEAGAIEFDGNVLYYTTGSGTRQTVAPIGSPVFTPSAAVSFYSVAPYAAVDSSQAPFGASAGSLGIGDSASADNTGGSISLKARNSSNNIQLASIGVVSQTGSGVYAPALTFGQSTGAAAYAERMRIDTSGNVGIGTTSPQATLDINGYARLKANASQPVACSSANDNALASTSHHTLCMCNGSTSTWVSSVDGTTTCAW